MPMTRDIKLAVLETLSEFGRREELIGWIPGNQSINAGALAEEIARLSKENTSLREQLSKSNPNAILFNSFTFEEVFAFLSERKLDLGMIIRPESRDALQRLSTKTGNPEPNLLNLFWLLKRTFRIADLFFIYISIPLYDYLCTLKEFGLIVVREFERHEDQTVIVEIGLTESGRSFLLRLALQPGMKDATEYALVQDGRYWKL
jgi:hypothetical protein